jgi:hypothetical protein
VGDFVTRNILGHGFEPDIVVIDNKVMREEVSPIKLDREEKSVSNDPGTISAQAYNTLREATILNKKLVVIVEGEEDLLVLPLMAMLPINSAIIYGLPGEGLVAMRITEDKRRWAMEFMDKMEED